MKKIITLIAIIISVCINCNGQIDSTEKILNDYIKKNDVEIQSINCELHTQQLWNAAIGLNRENIDSIIFVKIDNEMKPIVLLIDTIPKNANGYCDYFAVLIHDRYYYNNQLYFIYSFETKTNMDYGAVFREPEYYTTEPFTTVEVDKKEIDGKKIINYKFFRNYRNFLNPELEKKLGKIGLIDTLWE